MSAISRYRSAAGGSAFGDCPDRNDWSISGTTVPLVDTYDLDEAAERIGVSAEQLDRLVELKGVSAAMFLYAASRPG